MSKNFFLDDTLFSCDSSVSIIIIYLLLFIYYYLFIIIIYYYYLCANIFSFFIFTQNFRPVIQLQKVENFKTPIFYVIQTLHLLTVLI